MIKRLQRPETRERTSEMLAPLATGNVFRQHVVLFWLWGRAVPCGTDVLSLQFQQIDGNLFAFIELLPVNENVGFVYCFGRRLPLPSSPSYLTTSVNFVGVLSYDERLNICIPQPLSLVLFRSRMTFRSIEGTKWAMADSFDDSMVYRCSTHGCCDDDRDRWWWWWYSDRWWWLWQW